MKNVVLFLRNSAGHIIAGSLILAGGLIVAGMYATIESPYTGEIFTNYIISFGLTATCILAGVFGAIMVRGMYLSVTDVTHKMAPPLSLREQFESVFGPLPALAPKQAALPATANTFDISPDVLVFRLPGEPEAEYLARVEYAAGVATRIRWAVAIPFRSPVLTVFDGGNPVVYQRDEPIFVLPEWPDYDGRVVPAGTPFTGETEKQYTDYISTFSRKFREWAPRKKPQMYRDAMRGMSVLELMRTAAVSVFLLLSVSAFGQSKTEQVSAAFNGRPGIPPSGVEVMYDFGNKAIYRHADGRRNYAELLAGVPGFQDNGGKLVAVYAGTSKVATAQNIQDVAPRTNIGPGNGYVTESNTGDPVRPRPASDGSVIQPTSEQYRQFAVPDSSGMVSMIEGAKGAVLSAKESANQVIRPTLDFSWWMFGQMFLAMLIVGGVCWFFAKTSAEEGALGAWGETVFISPWLVYIHQNASAALMVILWIADIVLLLKWFTTLWNWGVASFWVAVWWVSALWLLRRIHNRIVPNIRSLTSGPNPYSGGAPIPGQKRI